MRSFPHPTMPHPPRESGGRTFSSLSTLPILPAYKTFFFFWSFPQKKPPFPPTISTYPWRSISLSQSYHQATSCQSDPGHVKPRTLHGLTTPPPALFPLTSLDPPQSTRTPAPYTPGKHSCFFFYSVLSSPYTPLPSLHTTEEFFLIHTICPCFSPLCSRVFSQSPGKNLPTCTSFFFQKKRKLID